MSRITNRRIFVLTNCFFVLFFGVLSSAAQAYILVSYNVENLFDADHDTDKKDWEYLPIDHPEKAAGCRRDSNGPRMKDCLETDWNDSRLALKFSQIKRVAASIKPGSMPDFMALVEVENANVVGQLAKELGDYKYKVTNSPDERGIDVAVVYKDSSDIQLLSFQEHQLKGPEFEKQPTRNILQANFKVSSGELILFVNHWPSQANPVQNRLKAAIKLREVMDKAQQEHPKALVMAMGDFNVAETDAPHPIRTELLKGIPKNDLFMENNDKDNTVHPDYSDLPKPTGTYFYKKDKQWNFLDRFFVVTNNNSGPKIVENSEHIVAPYFAMKVYNLTGDQRRPKNIGIPWAYNHNTDHVELAGFSDHFPIALEFH